MSTQQILRLSYEEMMYVSAFLDVGLEGAAKNKTNKRIEILKTAQRKIVAALEQAEKDGLFDPTVIKI